MKMELAFPEKSGFVVLDASGFGPPKATINTSKMATMDGSRLNSTSIDQRNIVLTLAFLPNPTIEDTRQKSYKYFPVKKTISLLIETDKRLCQTYGSVESNEPVIFNSEAGTQISIICPDPYLYAAGPDSKNVAVFFANNPLFEFPFSNESELEVRLKEIRARTLATPTDPEQEVSPDNPQTLTSLTSFDYQVSGVNLFDINSVLHRDATKWSLDDDWHVTTNYSGGEWRQSIPVKSGLKISASLVGKYVGTSSGGYKGIWAKEPLTATTIPSDLKIAFDLLTTSSAESTIKTENLTVPDGYTYLILYTLCNASTGIFYFKNLQVEIGSTATTYEPYTGITKTITLKDTLGNQLEARTVNDSVGNEILDCIVKINDKWYLENDTGYVKITQDTELAEYMMIKTNTIAVSVTSTRQVGSIPAILINSNISAYYANIWNTDVEGVSSFGNDSGRMVGFRINRSRLATNDLAGAKQYLISVGAEAVYNLRVPTYTELCAADQTALNEAEAAGTFDGITNIMLSTPIGQVYAVGAKNTEVLKDTEGTFANRPLTGKRQGQSYTATDTGKVYHWSTSLGWILMN